MAKRITMLSAYCASHFAVDFSCAYLMFSSFAHTESWLTCVLIYNFCAFALQMPLGIIADKLNRNCLLACAGCAVTAVSFYMNSPLICAAAAGMGNGMFHVGGGTDVLNLSEKKMGSLGVFVSPGAFGIYFGAMLGRQASVSPLMFTVLATAAVYAMLISCGLSNAARASGNKPFSLESPRRAKAVLPVVMLFIVVCLRSYSGMLMNFAWKGQTGWSAAAICAVVFGKTAGGFAADRLGSRAASLSLAAACALFFFADNPFAGTAAIFLFNMTMPVTLFEVAKLLPGAKGFSFGMLTFALFLGFVPVYLGITPPASVNNAVLACASAVSLALMLAACTRKVRS